MKKVKVFFVISFLIVSCSGPKFFNSPADYMGGNNASAEVVHCQRTGGTNKDGMAYKLCKKSFNNHYGN